MPGQSLDLLPRGISDVPCRHMIVRTPFVHLSPCATMRVAVRVVQAALESA